MRLSPADRQIVTLAVPAFAALVSEPLFLLADAAIVGHLGTPQLAGLGVAGAALQTLVGLCVFLAYGTTGSVARRAGAGDQRGALTQGLDGMWLALGLGVVLAAAAAVWAGPVVALFGPGPAVQEQGTTYLRIAAFGIPGMLVLLAATGVLRGLLDTRTPMAVAIAGNLANVALNLLLVYPAGLGIAGSALGTVLAQSAAATALVVVVGRSARRSRARTLPDVAGIIAAARSGVPLVVRTATLRAALLLCTYVATAQGTTALAAHQVASAVWSFLAFALDAIAIAGQAITGGYLGAGDVDGARASTRRMMRWGLASGLALAVLLAACSAVLTPVFTPDQQVQHLLRLVLLVAAVFQPVAGVVFVLDGVLIGAGDGRYLAVAGVLTLAAFTPLALAVLAADAGLVWLWWAFGGFMLARLVTLAVRERSSAWLVVGAAR